MKIPSYMRIFMVLGDIRWHNKADFCRPYSQDDRRLREMKERGWIDYEDRIIRKDGVVSYTEYRHKHYQTFGNEKLEDLIILCKRCHSDTHFDKWFPEMKRLKNNGKSTS